MGHSNCDRCGHDTKMCDCPPYVAQEGGDHYQVKYQHWDWVLEAEIGYLAGNASKYISRWRKKNGIQDLSKALTYIDKMIVTRDIPSADWHYRSSRWKIAILTDRFIESAGLTEEEGNIIHLLAGPCPVEMLKLARQDVENLIRSAQTAASAARWAAVQAMPPQATPPAQQALRGSPEAIEHKTTMGMEHPFGYDSSQEQGKENE